MDTNRDDRIGLPEYSQYLVAHGIGGDLAAVAFQRMDTNGDGIITFDDFRQISTDFFFSDDENAPGNWLWASY